MVSNRIWKETKDVQKDPPTSCSAASLDSPAQTGHADGGDWQEEVYQKIKTLKETYSPELNEMYQKISAKLQQPDSLTQQRTSEQLDKLKIFKTMLERIITFLSVSKANIPPSPREKLPSYEKQIINLINVNRPREPCLSTAARASSSASYAFHAAATTSIKLIRHGLMIIK
ncbi:hypothetical protein DITRI_Ditri13aG0045800 [Diplodiscus trichospermus]